jgi:hypothetical protein
MLEIVKIANQRGTVCPVCEIIHDPDSMDPHHPDGREGEKLFDFFLTCRRRHVWIHNNPKLARGKGWLK